MIKVQVSPLKWGGSWRIVSHVAPWAGLSESVSCIGHNWRVFLALFSFIIHPSLSLVLFRTVRWSEGTLFPLKSPMQEKKNIIKKKIIFNKLCVQNSTNNINKEALLSSKWFFCPDAHIWRKKLPGTKEPHPGLLSDRQFPLKWFITGC